MFYYICHSCRKFLSGNALDFLYLTYILYFIATLAARVLFVFLDASQDAGLLHARNDT